MSPLVGPEVKPYVTVFIPAFNGARWLEEMLTALEAQVTEFAFEILVIDSGSTDETLAILARHRLRLITIPNREFDHGATRNRAVEEARGDIVVLTVQDATPANPHWLAGMVSHFQDPEVGGVYCDQIPRPDCSPFLRERLARWVQGGGQPKVSQVKDVDHFWNVVHPNERWNIIKFDNVASAVRRSTALTHPFPRRRFGEDVTWAKGAILAGWKIVYEPRVAVVHSHPLSIWYEFKRAYLDHQNVNDLVGSRLAPRLRNVFEYTAAESRRLFGVVWRDETLDPVDRIIWMLKVLPFAFTQNLGQYLGPLSNVHGRRGWWRWWDRWMGKGV
jgi:rhamnosyltransferase